MSDARPRVSRARLSLAARIAVVSALFGLVVASGAVGVGYWALSHELDARAADEMRGRRELLEHVLATVPSREAIPQAKSRFQDLFFGHDDLHLAIADAATAEVLVRFSDVATESVTVMNHAMAPADTLHSWVTPQGERFGGLHGTTRLANGQPVRYYLSVDRHRDTMLLAGFVKATLLALPLLLVIVATGAGLIARTSLSPLRTFNRLAASIGARSLNRRLSAGALPRELADMAIAFNGMLDRIDEGYRQLEDFSGDLAHEMRTPVATLLGRTQVALSQNRSAGELREVLEGNVEELERLSTLISDMLFIARAEHDAAPLQRDAVDLAHEARRVADYLSIVAEEKGLELRVAGEAPPLPGDRLLIQRAITNLLSNAIRHAFDHSSIQVDVGREGTVTTLAVTNEGDAIAPASQARIFERFYRADPARTRLGGGSGLGLAIVRSIASAHHGTVGVESMAGCTTFTLRFPQAQATG